jgi:ribose-phosphate pyrophosphokinase
MPPRIRIASVQRDPMLARRIARMLGLKLEVIRTHTFPDGEPIVRVAPGKVREAVIVHRFDDRAALAYEFILAADAMRRAGAQTVTLVAPYLPFMRQDRVFRAGEPISQRAFGHLLAAFFDRVLTVEAHLHRVCSLAQVVSPGSRSISAAGAIARWIGRPGRDTVIVGPDEESGRTVSEIARLAKCSAIVGRKRRIDDRRVVVELPEEIHSSRAIIVDDIASSGATIAATSRAIRASGCKRIEAVVVHAIFASGAIRAIHRAGVTRVVSCDTVEHPTNAISVAPIFALALTQRAGGLLR